MNIKYITAIMCVSATGILQASDTPSCSIQQAIESYVADKDARIGVAVITEEKDTISVNGNRDFPMLSVFKFPQALAVADYCTRNGVALSDSVAIEAGELKDNTWSPMRDKYGIRDIKIPMSDLLDYSLQQSDNNACDVLFRVIGGVTVADSLMKSLGFDDIVISATEDDMHRDPYLCYLNRTTPIAMARLFESFYRGNMWSLSPIHKYIADSMTACSTGVDRLPAPLLQSGIMIGHKTGTGDMNSEGRIIAVNDAGYIFLPDNKGYAIAVLVADSAYDMKETSKIISDISGIVYECLK